MAHSLYGDNSSFMYHQGYGYSPYATYPSPGSPAPTMGQDGQLYGPQHYQYPIPYHQPSAQTTRPYPPNQVNMPQREISTSVAADQVPLSVGAAEGNPNIIASGGRVNEKSGLKAQRPSVQNSSWNSYPFYERGGSPVGFPSLPTQDPRFGFDEIRLPNTSLITDGQSKRGARARSSSPFMHANNISSWRNQNLCRLPHFMNWHDARPASGLGLASGFTNQMYQSNGMYGQFGNTFGGGLGFGSFGYDSRTGGRGLGLDIKHKRRGCGNGALGYGNENLDGANELSKGPRAKGFDSKNQNGFGPITLAVKEQKLPLTENNNKEDNLPLIPNKEEYNREDFPEDHSDAKFFVIKSYSEDDVHKSIKYGVWASTRNGNKKLDTAYQESKEKPGGCPVFLLFSVNSSGQFVGLAEMIGPVNFEKTVEYWQQDKWNGCFPVKWHTIKDVPNSLLRHIILENNENKPVTNSRDTQEVKFEQGIQILKIFKGHLSKTCILDDFGFYEARQRTIQERKVKQQDSQVQVGNPSDAVTDVGKEKLPKSSDTTSIKEPVATEAAALAKAQGDVKLSEEKGSAAAASEEEVVPNGAC
ncbi:YTH domain-containing protein ECT2-like isoform X3 [Alnus glutinosa]|nr:YTH domain-containing protein ECT2-like isoform X3 [Alnus glutinosa]